MLVYAGLPGCAAPVEAPLSTLFDPCLQCCNVVAVEAQRLCHMAIDITGDHCAVSLSNHQR